MSAIKETNLDEVIEEDCIEEYLEKEQYQEQLLDKNEQDLNEKDAEKQTKNKKRRSLFRKSKKDKKSKSLDETAKSAAEEGEKTEQLLTSSDAKDTDDNRGKSAHERRSLFRRKNTKSHDTNEEDAATQTGNIATVSPKKESENEVVTSEDIPKQPRKRSLVQRLTKLKKSTKWTNTIPDNTLPDSTNSTTCDEPVKTESDEKSEEDQTELASDHGNTVLENGVQGEEYTSSDKDNVRYTSDKNDDSYDADTTTESSEGNSDDTFIIKEGIIEESLKEEKLKEKTPSPQLSNEAIFQSSHNPFLETCESEFTNVTPMPYEYSEVSRDTTVTVENVTREGTVDKPEMEDIPLISDESQLDNSMKIDSSPSNQRKQERVPKPDKLDYVLVGRVNEKSTDESFFLAKKAVKVYKNAQLSKQYCQACCSVM